MFNIYHIPTFVHKDGSIGKIGCTSQKPKVRVEKQGYSSFEILETHDCIDRASVREQELQKEYGYKVDCNTYKIAYNNRPKFTDEQRMMGTQARKREILQYDLNGIFLKEWECIIDATRSIVKHSNSSLIRGVLRGDKPSAYGFMFRYKENNDYPKKIKPKGKRYPVLECPYCGLKARGIGYHRYHGNNCKLKTTSQAHNLEL